MKKLSIPEIIFDIFNYFLLSLLIIITLYPCLYVLFASISDPVEIYRGSKILLYPRGFNLGSYRKVFENPMIWIGYGNTLIYVIAGTTFSMLLTILGAFGLSRSYLPGRYGITLFIIFTMYFSGGLIPTYLVVRNLGMLDSMLSMILPSAINTFNLIIMITYFKSIPSTLEEAAKIDGANEYKILFKVILPLAAPVIAVIVLYYAVAKWNTYFQALIYLNKRTKFPLQIILREILIQNDGSMTQGMGVVQDIEAFSENIKYATIVVSTIPILMVYPFLQKYFVKGVMIGAIKE